MKEPAKYKPIDRRVCAICGYATTKEGMLRHTNHEIEQTKSNLCKHGTDKGTYPCERCSVEPTKYKPAYTPCSHNADPAFCVECWEKSHETLDERVARLERIVKQSLSQPSLISEEVEKL